MDLRNFLAENLAEYYQVSLASDGAEGLKIATDTLPDLIISDVGMPKLNGIKLVKYVKSSIATSHIPVILLSKKAQIEDEIKGLKYGADDYIGKPFNMQYLLLKIKNILKYRQKIKSRLADKFDEEDSEVLDYLSEFDNEFLKNCKKVIIDNISNTEFNLDELSKSVGLSARQINRKLKNLIDQTPMEWIYSFRLEEAKRLLQSGKSILEVADLTGFTTTKSFGTVFKRKFGVAPKDFMR